MQKLCKQFANLILVMAASLCQLQLLTELTE